MSATSACKAARIVSVAAVLPTGDAVAEAQVNLINGEIVLLKAMGSSEPRTLTAGSTVKPESPAPLTEPLVDSRDIKLSPPDNRQPGTTSTLVITSNLRGAAIYRATHDLVALGAGLQAYKREKEDMNAALKAARLRYWEAMPDGAGIEEARQNLSALLFQKDMFHAAQLPVRYANNQFFQTIRQLAEAYSGEAAEPIHQFSVKAFEAWAGELTHQVANGRSGQQALQATLPLYSEYARRRDAAEYLFANPRGPLHSSTPVTFTAAVLFGCELHASPDDVAQQAAAIAEAAGDEAILSAAISQAREQIKQASFPEDSRKGYCSAEKTLTASIAEFSPRFYAVRLLREHSGLNWREANLRITQWERTIGQQPLVAAAAKVQKTDTGLDQVGDASLCRYRSPMYCLTDLLNLPPPAAKLSFPHLLDHYRKSQTAAETQTAELREFALAEIQRTGIGTKEAADRYSRLVSLFGEKMLLSTIDNTRTVFREYPEVQILSVIAPTLRNFSLFGGNDRAFLISLMLVQKDGSRLNVTKDLETIEREYQTLVTTHGEQKLLDAVRQYRVYFVPLEYQHWEGSPRFGPATETAYTAFVNQLATAK